MCAKNFLHDSQVNGGSVNSRSNVGANQVGFPNYNLSVLATVVLIVYPGSTRRCSFSRNGRREDGAIGLMQLELWSLTPDGKKALCCPRGTRA